MNTHLINQVVRISINFKLWITLGHLGLLITSLKMKKRLYEYLSLRSFVVNYLKIFVDITKTYKNICSGFERFKALLYCFLCFYFLLFFYLWYTKIDKSEGDFIYVSHYNYIYAFWNYFCFSYSFWLKKGMWLSSLGTCISLFLCSW